MTPFAVLLVKPTDDDLTIRKRFHELSKIQHPDRAGAGGMPGENWHQLVTAYSLIKTEERRAAYRHAQARLAHLCPVCFGSGVTWKRVGKDKSASICTKCNGEGRVKK